MVAAAAPEVEKPQTMDASKTSAAAMYGAVAGSTNESSRSSPAHDVPARQPRSDRRKPAAARTSPRLVRAVKFLTHPTVVDLPHEDKVNYLRNKGLTPQEVDEALGLVGLVEEDGNTEMDGAWNDDGGEDDGFGAEDGRDVRRRRRGQQPTNRQYPPPSSQHLDNQTMQPYQQQQALAEPPGLALPLTVGGVLGVTAIATLRWLNGGDFVMFPPPSAPVALTADGDENQGVKFRAGGTSAAATATPAGNETTVDSTIEEDGDGDGAAVGEDTTEDTGFADGNYTTDEADVTIYDYLDEYLGNGEEEEEVGGGKGQGGANNDTTYVSEESNDRYRTATDFTYESGNSNPNSLTTTTNNPPDLTRRLQDLTTAVEKFVAVQERTLKTKADERGQAVTNSAMDLLRRSPSGGLALSTPAVTPYRNGVAVQVPPQPQGTPRSIGGDSDGSVPDVAVAVLVTKMKCQLIGLREAIKDAGRSTGGGGSHTTERSEQKLDEVTTTFERLESMLLGGKQISDYETELPEAANVASMYETPSRMFETGELSPVPGCKDGEDDEVTHLDVTLEMEMSPARTSFAKEEEQNAIAAAAAAVAGKTRTLQPPPVFEIEDLEPTSEESIGRAALSQAIDVLSNPTNNSIDAIKTCAQMLYLYVVNLSSNASSKRYRRVYTTNANFKNKVGSAPGGVAVLESLGFVDKGSYMEWEGDIDIPEGTVDQDCGLALLNHAAAQLSLLKVTGTTREDRRSVAFGATTPRQRCTTPVPPGAPPRPTTINNSDSAGSAGSSVGSAATAGTNTATSVASPSGFVTPRMRGDGNDRYVASPANSLASTNVLASPPVIKQIPSRQDDGVADKLFGNDQEAHLQETQREDLVLPPTPSRTNPSQNGRGTTASEGTNGGIFRTTRKILPPRAPSRGPPVDNIGDFDSIFGVNNGSAFMSRAGSNMSAQSEPNFEAGGLGLSLKLRRSPASEDAMDFAPRRNSDRLSTHVGPNKVSSAPQSASHSPTKDQGKSMIFNLTEMAVNVDDMGADHLALVLILRAP
eukprot:CAMPEP_0185807664 /NCGR_PEP_ID=MMETSP1322-20130828/5143_1 /TAXON_ID=265543 /ORGANISM="Minutocellus polymorphus, Strain RCC2270" /LENGTH=1034 /DNA_ID=CAMNT_0028503821 /DNA_START=104 /DNA_END=3209 /DNA_ORIENTATION=+